MEDTEIFAGNTYLILVDIIIKYLMLARAQEKKMHSLVIRGMCYSFRIGIDFEVFKFDR